MIEYVIGDLLNSKEADIAHGCNCQGVMGAGIAGAIAQEWPHVREEYVDRCRSRTFVLGTAQPVIGHSKFNEYGQVTIWNLGTQKEPGPNAVHWGVLLSFANMFEQMVEWGVSRVGIPRIGCGIGGLTWANVEFQIKTAQNLVGPDAPLVVVYTQESQSGVEW